MSLRIRFVDGSQIDFQDVQKATEDRETVTFTYDDPGLKGRTKICIRKSSIVFMIEING